MIYKFPYSELPGFVDAAHGNSGGLFERSPLMETWLLERQQAYEDRAGAVDYAADTALVPLPAAALATLTIAQQGQGQQQGQAATAPPLTLSWGTAAIIAAVLWFAFK